MINTTLKLIIFLSSISLAQNYGDMFFTTFADDRKSAFSLTFDDGLKTHFDYVKPALDAKNFKGTFYVLPPFLAEAGQPTIWRYGTWSEFQLLAAEGHEIGSHTMRHFDLTTLPWGSTADDSTLLYELYQSKIYIEQKIPYPRCISLNYPFTYRNSVVDSAASFFYENGRTLGQVPNESSLINEEWFKLNAKVVLFDQPRSSFEDDLAELYSFLDWTQNSINNNKWGMIIIHDVVPASQLSALVNQGIYEPISTEWLSSLCDFLSVKSNNNEVWVETVGNITRYIKERENASYQIISSNVNKIEINVNDNLDNSIYDFPLSAYVKIPDDWYYVSVEQNGKIDTLTTTLSDSGRMVLLKVIPDKGLLKISPAGLTSVKEETNTVRGFMLNQNFPNPFNPSTKISWQSPVGSWQTLKVYDVLGNEVATLIDEYKPAGNYEAEFNIMHESIRAMTSGVYFYQLRTGGFVQTRKMILLK